MITALVAASIRENVVVLNAWMPRMAIKGSMRMAGNAGAGRYQCPLKKTRSPVAGGLIRYSLPCMNEAARKLK